MTRTRVWAFIFYPDEKYFPKNWRDLLHSVHADMIISPLHNPDGVHVSPDEKDFEVHRKRHYHGMIMFDGVKTQQQVTECLSCLDPFVTYPFPVHSMTGYTRYMVHLGYPDKEQFEDYNTQFITFGDGQKKVEEAFEIGEFDSVKIIQEINQFILDNGITEFFDLYQYAVVDAPKWAYVLDKFPCRSTHALLSSQRHGGHRNA